MKKSLLLALAAAASCAASAAVPTTTGWYKIQLVDQQITGGSELLNADAEYVQSTSNSYALRFGTSDENKPAKSFIYITVSGNTKHFTSINGHGINENCTSARDQLSTSNPAVTASGTNVKIGYWSTFTPTGSSITYVGKSSKSNHAFSVTPVEDGVLSQYDIWTAHIHLQQGATIEKDAKISYNNENNKGITAVYNGGKFFVTKGTTISESDLTISNYTGTYDLLIDNESHSIYVTAKSDIATNKYIRIGAKSEGYYYDMTANGNPCFSQDANTAIYYYDSNKRLVHYGEGRAAIKNTSKASFLDNSTTAAQNADFLANTHCIDFIACTNSAAQGRYFVSWYYTPKFPYALLYCYSSGDPDYPLGSMGNGSTDTSKLQGLAASNQNWTFSIEDVTELPVKIGEDGKGTMIVPVAVTVPTSDDFTFYTASTDSNGQLIFTEVSAGNTIPANTHIVIKRATSCSDTTCNVTLAIAENANEAAPAALATETSERFLGSYLATVAPTPGENEEIYVKCATDAATDENGVVFTKVAPGATLPAGTLAFKAVKNSEAEAPATLTLDLTAANPGTTAINSIYVENEPANGAIYDLQGRRLSAPVKGINIINGRKVLVK